MNKPTPRINASLQEKYVDKTVRIIGKVKSFAGDSAVLTTTDGGQVLVQLNGESQWGSEYMEVIGRVEKNFTIMEYKSTNLGNDFDMDLANKVVEYAQKCPEIFE
ncbi:hypothetical protein VTP01DRAFT_5505 [Rhizomucor pusillus]|uniref:uncharacterized protein n=1 Tax=Rhizomucor pusillus TaxID=4840 RepID=UPI003742DFD6